MKNSTLIMAILILLCIITDAFASDELGNQFRKNTKQLEQASYEFRRILNVTEKDKKFRKIQTILIGVNSALTAHEYTLMILESKKYANQTGAYNQYLFKVLDYSKKKIQSARIQIRSNQNNLPDKSVRDKAEKAHTTIVSSLGIIDTMLTDIKSD